MISSPANTLGKTMKSRHHHLLLSSCQRALRSRGLSTAKTRSTRDDDFAHHAPGVARLNHASFGAVPAPVLAAQQEFREEWLRQPDELYFSGRLHERMSQAAAAGATTLVPTTTTMTTASNHTQDNSPRPLPAGQVCLMENSTVATCTVAYRWSKMIQPGDVIIYFDVGYKACIHILKEYCERQGARLVPLVVPFPEITTPQELLQNLRQQLQELADRGLQPRFAFLDHIASQPSILFPIADIVQLVREFGQEDKQGGGVEVCIDAAHAVGSVPNLNVRDLECDFYYSNLHKWAFAPSTATIFWSPHLLPETRHVITSWAWGQGLAEEALFPGTRDFSAMAAVPAAVDYLRQWKSKEDGMPSDVYCHNKVQEAARYLRQAWNTAEMDAEMDDSLVATQAMVRLPPQLEVNDRPGQVSRGVRDRLREDYQIEASVGNFGPKGNFLRLSWAVYNDMTEIERLAKAILEIEHAQKK